MQRGIILGGDRISDAEQFILHVSQFTFFLPKNIVAKVLLDGFDRLPVFLDYILKGGIVRVSKHQGLL